MLQRSRAVGVLLVLLTAAVGAAQQLVLPKLEGSLKIAVVGDSGSGSSGQYGTAEMMARYHEQFPFDTVLMLGDNMYGRQEPRDFVEKFERPYGALLERGVKFYAALGNHDNQENRFYKPWNMNGQRYYTFKKGRVRFFVLDTDYLDQPQVAWLERELKGSNDDWKIAYFHHPLYSSGQRHGSERDLQERLEPLFVKYGVDVVFQGHDHIYERIRPQKGIHYFVEGSSGKLRRGDLRRNSPLTVVGNDQDYTFMMVEIKDDTLWFQTVTRDGKTVDAGTITRRPDDPEDPR